MTDCPIHKIRLETKIGNYKTQQFQEVEPYCPICKGERMSDKNSSVFSIITLKDEGESDSDVVEHLAEMMSNLDANFSFGSKVVKKCYCDNGIFYFTKDNQLKDSQICGNCKGQGYVELDSYDTKTGKYIFKGES